MKIEWLEHLKAVPGREVAPRIDLAPCVNYGEKSEPYSESVMVKRKWKFDLHLGVRRILDASASDKELQDARLEAARTIANTLYSPVIDQLIDLRTELYEAGAYTDDSSIKRINQMISAMILSDTPG